MGKKVKTKSQRLKMLHKNNFKSYVAYKIQHQLMLMKASVVVNYIQCQKSLQIIINN